MTQGYLVKDKDTQSETLRCPAKNTRLPSQRHRDNWLKILRYLVKDTGVSSHRHKATQSETLRCPVRDTRLPSQKH